MNDNKDSIINVEVNVSAKADLTPIIKATPKGFKYLSFLLFGKREANLEKYVRLSKALTDIDEKGVLEGRLIFNAKENTLLPTPQNLKEQIVGAIQDEEIQNLIACSIKAAENIKEAETDKEPSQDFINRWRNDTKQIHSEELQNIWGRLMAEEINNPDSISLRTLDVVKNISRDEAQSFVALLKYIMKVNSYKESYGIQIYMGWGHKQKNEFLLENASSFVYLDQLKDARLVLDTEFNIKNSFSIYEKRIHGEMAFYLETMNYIFYVPVNNIIGHPRISFLELSKEAQNIYQILKADKSYRRFNRKDAIDFIEIIKRAFLDYKVNYIYFGYIEEDGHVAEYEKYSF